MSDIVERLINLAVEHSMALRFEAADKIERQQLEIDGLKGAIRILEVGYDCIKSENERLRHEAPTS